MSDQSGSTSVIDDNRAVAPVIGVVILFGFLILALSLYQVEIVPQQNAETEFQHSGEVRNDLVELRAGILQAGSIDQPQYQTVQLGTTYSTRVFTINPPAPAGTIRTTDPYPITISNNSGTPEGTITIPTRFIEYQPGYNELDRSPTWYDASVLYLDARDEEGGIAVIEDQALVDNGEVQITALQNEFRRSGIGQVTLELRPAESVIGDIPEGDLTVTVPTRLSNEEYWDSTDIPENEYSITEDANDDGIYNLTLDTTTSNLTVDTVGVQTVPEEPTQNDATRVGGGESDGGTENGNVDTLPESAVAYDDTNGNGVYDADVDTAYERIKNFDDTSANLIIEKDSVENGNRMIRANSVTIRSGVTVESTNNDLTIESSGGNIIATGAILRSGDELTLSTDEENGDIDIQDATLSGDEIEASASEDGIVLVDGARIDGEEGEIEVEEGAISGTPAYGEVDD
ncbi:hypothetical protein EXE49_16395 [Halorubrum sp. ASP121]|uniref:hypothetical protein n=1 Tax=Halorubrum sp. ASP121 TaxID=1855858 RepID=UPI0010F9C773|nr:hypothetical protein [Halorubrum sp. ASP121]TKX48318.1 hypothetical protein EXE49_16395 [Halorubrum sp. ASP121]